MHRSLQYVTLLFVVYIIMSFASFAADKRPWGSLTISASSSLRLEVLVDLNGNGIKDGSDTFSLPPGTYAYLETKKDGAHYRYDTLGNGVSSTTLTPLASGTYQVIENLPNGWIATLAAAYNGTAVDTIRFLNFKLGTISGTVFEDLDGDSIKDIGESGLAGWTISCSGTMLGNTTTVSDSMGNYSLDSLGSGVHTVAIAPQSGWSHTIPSSGNYSFISQSGDNLTNLNFGYRGIYSVSGYVTTESNLAATNRIQKNSLYSPFKQGDPIGGVDVSLGKKPCCPLLSHTVTDDSGHYSFSNLSRGEYDVHITPPVGAIVVFPPETSYTFSLPGDGNYSNLNFRVMLTAPDTTWKIISSGTSVNLNAVGFFDEFTAVAVGDSGTIIRSTDGGVTWNPAATDTALFHANGLLGGGDPLKGLNISRPSSGGSGGTVSPCGTKGKAICVGGNGKTYQTTNYGASWKLKVSGTTANLRGVTSIDDSNVVAVGENVTLLYSSNGGNSWQPGTILGPTRPSFQMMGNTVTVAMDEKDKWYKEPCKLLLRNNLSSDNVVNIIAVGENGIAFKSTDKGVTWMTLPSFTGNSLYAGAGFEKHRVFVAGDSTFGQSPDGGATWNVSSENQSTIRNVTTVDSSSAYAVGDLGRIIFSKDYGTTWATEPSPVADNLTGVAHATFSDGYARVILAVGANGRILRKIERIGISVNLSVNNSWNLISVPVDPPFADKDSVFRLSSSDAFTYENGYAPKTSLTPGKGYWIKYNVARALIINGSQIDAETVDVSAKWNLVGSLSSEISASNITSIPPGLITSQFFKYGGGGYSTSGGVITPGQGYWVKCNGSGKLILSSTVLASTSNRIQIVPTSELPPSPPEENINTNNPIIPSEFALSQNYPNPFNPTTIINYAIPNVRTQHAVSVQLKIYNTLGQEVATLVDEMQEPGFKSVTFDASRIPSGIYFYRLTAGTWRDTKKLILMK